ncbi:MAG: DUF853 domain-containing protein [Gammaproteobacteria bacterium]|nr:DUF853 domain-containing protein [Gammaproteobacteria bacterium]MBT8150585.1 DUF853 domain-containing protein [Gammaproteobacteria bacterium]NND38390.1 DUF853 family protein [Pseudomonadales bacterium]NNM11193.1 DUF853 family protein [Pseudomonadales bacterium]RZV57940.1 MAG: DUF853 family protein [Pseudomonadales bacterium]
MQKNSITLGYVKDGPEDNPKITPVELDLKRANRHGLIAGATGTGKTVTLQGIAESLSNQGVPVFLCDIKGDVSGISQAGKPHPKINERLELLGLPTDAWAGCPTMFWDVYGKQGHPIRATISDMGPLLLSRLLNLNDTQEGILNIAFAVADDQGMLLLDLKDLRSMVQHVGDHAADLRTLYGNVSTSSIGAIQRRLLILERGGAKVFFGEPMLDLSDFMRRDREGRGYINVLAANKLYQEPAVYATVLLWLLSELFETLPEIGDPEKPELVMFFDEAHLMFKDAPKALVEKVEHVVRLIRSKGVGVYFITQSPRDVPDSVLSQLGNRVQHALRAFTPREQKAVATAADTFRANPAFSTRKAISELGVGEALVSTLQSKGVPTMVQRTFIKPPVSRIGPAKKPEREQVMQQSPCKNVYEELIDRDSAFEKLQARAEQAAEEAEQVRQTKARSLDKPKPKAKGRQRQGLAEAFAKSMVRSLGSKAGRSLARGVLGSLFKGR